MVLLNGIFIGILASIPLGPIGVLCIQRTINKNPKSGFYSGLGAASSDTIYSIIAGCSLTYIIELIKQYESFFQFLGAFILIVLGYHIFRSNPATEVRKYKNQSVSYIQDFFSTFFLTVSNPLAVLIFLSIFASFGLTINFGNFSEALIIIMGVFLGASLWWLILTQTVGLFRHKFKLRTLWWANKLAGAGIILFAIIATIYFRILPYLN